MRKSKIFTICVILTAIIIISFEFLTHHEMNDVDNIKFIEFTQLYKYNNNVDGYIADNENEIKSVNNWIGKIHFLHRKTEPLLNWYTLSRKQDVIVVIKYKDETTRIIETEGCEAVIFDRSNDNRPVLDSVKCYYVNPLEIKMLLNHFIPK